MTWLDFLLFRLSVGVEGGLNLILFNLWVFALWPVVHRDNSVKKTTCCIFMCPFFCNLSRGWLLMLKSKEQEISKLLELLCTLLFITVSNIAIHTYHSSGRGYTVCLRALSGSYSKDTPAVGFHLACSFPKPFLAYARSRSSWPLRSFTTKMSVLWSQQRCLKIGIQADVKMT